MLAPQEPPINKKRERLMNASIPLSSTGLIARVRGILLTPRTEWPAIAGENATVAGIYRSYVLVMAGIAAVAQFISFSLIGIRVPQLGFYRAGILQGLETQITRYVLALIAVYVLALIVDSLAPAFNGEKNQVQALKTVAYAYTPAWVASVIGIIPGLRLVAALVGAVYAVWLIRLGLPCTMKCPQDRAVGYTAVTILVAIVVTLVLSLIVRSVLGGYPGFGQSAY
jgi:hypothetical protein